MPDTLTPLYLALDHHQAERLTSAEAGYRSIIEDNPAHVEALHYLGVLLHQRGVSAQAAPFLDRALVLSPEYAACWSNRGLVAAALGDAEFAVACQRRALAVDPSFANAYNNLGVALQKTGRDDEAVDAYQKALAQQPDFIDAYTNFGSALFKLKRHEDALAAYRDALRYDPQNSTAHFGEGNALRELGRLDDAIRSLQRAVELAPAHFESRVNLGTTLGLRGRFVEAEAQYRHALKLRDDPQIHVCVGASIGAQGRFSEEEPHYRHALTLDVNHADAQHNLALLHLRRGEFEQGWTLYETRWRASKYTPIELPGIAEWAGEPLAGRTLLLVGEQGHGDQLQFVRYAAVLERTGAAVDVLVPSNIAELVGGVRGVRRVLLEKPQEGYDFWTPMMSVPHHVAGVGPGVPADVPYLRVSGVRIGDWPQRVADLAGGRRRVGVVWAGSPTFANDRFRSMPLAALAPLADAPGIAWFSLQKGPARAQLEGAALNLYDLTGQVHDFADTAALIDQLDLVITVDTSVAHLAGALGKPVWVMLSKNYDWRWMLDRDDSPWYPTMRLFKQTTLGDWTNVTEAVRKALIFGGA
ncbi:tetratricopeptide repeat protein [Caballeronia humi]|uniref:Tetratricopeptide repeat protein n=1 Tax=Caballeronia humi TaxID=326474 RepID=A0A158GDK9_9BURK|nr:tetratricopeptide repeat protein [Caballeronia humi]SAL30195.1 tetratricopeptide repeat protein [Caballeronia humi]